MPFSSITRPLQVFAWLSWQWSAGMAECVCVFLSGALGGSGSSLFQLSVWGSAPPMVGSEVEKPPSPPPLLSYGNTEACLLHLGFILRSQSLFSISLSWVSPHWSAVFIPSVCRCLGDLQKSGNM